MLLFAQPVLMCYCYSLQGIFNLFPLRRCSLNKSPSFTRWRPLVLFIQSNYYYYHTHFQRLCVALSHRAGTEATPCAPVMNIWCLVWMRTSLTCSWPGCHHKHRKLLHTPLLSITHTQRVQTTHREHSTVCSSNPIYSWSSNLTIADLQAHNVLHLWYDVSL